MSILLTGGTGFVGQQVSKHYNIKKQVVRKGEKHSYSSVYKIKSLNGKTNWNGAFNDVDTVIHLAGLAHSHLFKKQDYQFVNVDGTLHLASEAAKVGIKRFVFVSSIGVNGAFTADTPFSAMSKLHPHNDYAQSKYDAELGLKKIASETGMEVVIVRPTLVYGLNAPGNFGSLVNFVAKAPFLPFGLTKNRRDFISVQNLADLLIACAKHPDAGNQVFLASENETVSIKQFTNAIAKGLGKNIIQLPIPVWLMRWLGGGLGKSAIVEQLVGNLEVDSSSLSKVLGWTPPYTMEESMASLSEDKK